MKIFRFRHALAVAALGLSLGSAPSDAATESFEPPSSLSGSYLAGRSADIANDVDAALSYLKFALAEDPGNGYLIERVLALQLAAGDVEDSFDLAEKLVITQRRDLTARVALAASAMAKGRYDLALNELKEVGNSPLAALTGGLLKGWALQGHGDTDAALKTVDDLVGPSWYNLFKDYHKALIADAAGRKNLAAKSIARAYEAEGGTFRIIEAYARIMSRAGQSNAATKALDKFLEREGDNPLLLSLVEEVRSGKTPVAITPTARDGASEVLYGIGAVLGDEDATLAAGYLQLAHFLRPDAAAVLGTLGNLFQTTGQCEKAIEMYGRVATSSPLHRSVSIQTGACLDALGRTEEAAKEIRALVTASPSDLDAVLALANLYRSHERFAEAAEVLSIGIDTIKEPRRADWYLYYTRGVSFERTKRWPQAEADFKEALKLFPDQPQVLNYLGYTWVDMGTNLEEALGMIRTAVDLRPNDGAMVDSLGWAFYRLGRYEEAVEQLERAIDLQPEDPVINDHLGDAYWQVGRKREATFQWAHARDLKPSEADLAKILSKLQNGLKAASVETTPSSTTAQTPAKPTPVASIDPAQQTKAPPAKTPTSITVQAGDSLATIAERVYGNRELYGKIFEANRDRLASPDKLRPGMTLIIPAHDAN